MPNQIPGALQYLTQYLQGENARLDKIDKEQQLNSAIIQTADKFKKLGPDASQEDARALFYDSLKVAAQSGTEEAIPFIQGVYSDTLQYIQQTKIQKEDAAFKNYLSPMLGESGKGLTGQQGLQALDLTTKMAKLGHEEKLKTGESVWRSYTIKNGNYVVNPEGSYVIDATTLQDKFKYEKALIEVRERISGSNIEGQKSTYLVTVMVNGIPKDIPASFDPKSQTYQYYLGGKLHKYDPADPNTSIREKGDPGIGSYRDARHAKIVRETAYEDMVSAGGSLARILSQVDSSLDTNTKNTLINSVSMKPNEDSINRLVLMATTPSPDGQNSQLATVINSISDPIKRQEALTGLGKFTSAQKDYTTSSSYLKGTLNMGETGEEDKGNKDKGKTPPAPVVEEVPYKQDRTKTLSNNLWDIYGNPPKLTPQEEQTALGIKEFLDIKSTDSYSLKAYIGQKLGKDPNMITSETFDNLDINIKKEIIDRVNKNPKKKKTNILK